MAFVPLYPMQSPRQPTRQSHRAAVCRAVPMMTATVPKTFTISKTVMPSDSDYSSSLWHGSYVRWLEEARVRFLTFRKLSYDQLVRDHATELVVRDLRIRYLSPAKLGEDITVSVRMEEPNGRVRIVMHSEFTRESDNTICARAEVTLAPINIANGKVYRVWPDVLNDALLSET